VPHARALAPTLATLGAALLLYGSYRGLFVAPPDRFMGDVMRIMYVHVPAAWIALLTFTAAMIHAVLFLVTRKFKHDHLLEATVEVGVVLGALLCVLGATWARPTWGTWWDWDPRLTSMAVTLLAFVGVAALRAQVDDPAQRASWSAVATIGAWVGCPLTYVSVRLWNSLHQVQSSPSTVDAEMVLPLRINAFGMLFVAAAFVLYRAELARRRHARLEAA
jgi:heme exporter protein C